MSRIGLLCVAASLGAVACSSSYQLQPVVQADTPNVHLVEGYATALSYTAGSVVGLSGRLDGEDLILTVAVRNASDRIATLVPENILVVEGAGPSGARVLPVVAPSDYVEREIASQLSRLSLEAHATGWAAIQKSHLATESDRIATPSSEGEATTWIGPSDASSTWSSHARRSREVAEDVEMLSGLGDAIAEGLLWTTNLMPGEYTYGHVVVSGGNRGRSSRYRVVVPVGSDLHELLLRGPEVAPLSLDPIPDRDTALGTP